MFFVLTIIAVLLFTDLFWWWAADHLLRGRSRWWRLAVGGWTMLQIAGLAMTIASRALGTNLDLFMPLPFEVAIYIWHLFILSIILVGALVYGLYQAARLLRPAQAAIPPEGSITRRSFLAAGVATAPALIGLGATTAGLQQVREFRTRKLTVSIPQLPPALEGFTITHLSDLHVGRFTYGRVLEEIVESTNGLGSDLVVFTGDLINFAMDDLPAGLDVLTSVKARHGVYVCEGNHDLFEDAPRFRREVSARVPFLHNESAQFTVGGQAVDLLGLRWGSARRGSDGVFATATQELLTKRRPEAFPILLAHHPHAWDAAEGVPLTLAGHTHGGQLMLTPEIGFGPLMFRYWSGLYQRDGRSLVVSNGAGNWFPIRTAAPAEIVQVTLRGA